MWGGRIGKEGIEKERRERWIRLAKCSCNHSAQATNQFDSIVKGLALADLSQWPALCKLQPTEKGMYIVTNQGDHQNAMLSLPTYLRF